MIHDLMTRGSATNVAQRRTEQHCLTVTGAGSVVECGRLSQHNLLLGAL